MRLGRQGSYGWRGWGVNWYHKSSYSACTPFGGLGVNQFRAQNDSWLSRGRCREWELRIPLIGEWQLELATPGKSYLELVGGPKYLKNLSWILDEFDASFNDLAVASLKYHLDWSVCNNEYRRLRYEDLIRRLQEREPDMCDTAEERAIMKAAFEFPLNEHETPESRALSARYHEREVAYEARMLRARYDFVDIMRELWS